MLSAGRHEMYIPFCPATAVHLHSALGHSELGKAAQTLPSGVCGPGLAGDRPSAAHHHQPGAGPPWSGAGRIRNVHSGGLVFACDVCDAKRVYVSDVRVGCVNVHAPHPGVQRTPPIRTATFGTVSINLDCVLSMDVLMDT